MGQRPARAARTLGSVTQWGLEAIFNPGKRFDDDERKRLQATREEAGDASGGRRIDLGSGKVVIAKRDSDEGDQAKDPATSRREKLAAAREARAAERQENPAGRRSGRKSKRP
jgi:hypothetical protein